MSEENVEIVRRGYEAFREGGIEAVAELLDPDIEWIPPREAPQAGTYRGPDAVKTEVREFTGPFEDYEWEPREFIDAGDRVVVIGYHRGRGRQSGVEIGQEETHLWTVRNGKIVRLEMFHDRAEALQSAGLAGHPGL
jgi:ketosteroid isomerase-like protein